jgi:hypothetical protein
MMEIQIIVTDVVMIVPHHDEIEIEIETETEIETEIEIEIEIDIDHDDQEKLYVLRNDDLLMQDIVLMMSHNVQK